MPRRTAFALILLSALTGCTNLALEAPVAIDGSRPTDIGEKLPLRPGMILFAATPTWGPTLGEPYLRATLPGVGSDLGVPLAIGGRQPQLGELLRVPIRKVNADSQLTDEELLFLGTVISLQRRANFGAITPEDIRNVQPKWHDALTVPADRAALWNALIEATALKRHALPNEARSVLFLRLTPNAFCRSLARSGRADLLTLVKQGLFKGGCDEQNAEDDGEPYVEAFALGVPAGDEYDPLVAMTVNTERAAIDFDQIDRTNQYFLGPPQFAPASIVRAEFGGITLQRPGRSESLWSLADWERSGICGGAIESVSFAGNPLRFRIVKDPTNGTATSDRPNYVIRERNESGQMTRSVVLLDRKGNDVADGKSGRIILDPRLAHNNLDNLRAADITHITWSTTAIAPTGDCTK